MNASRLELGASHSATHDRVPPLANASATGGQLVKKYYTVLIYYVINACRLSAFSCSIPMPPSTHPLCSTLTPHPGLLPSAPPQVVTV